MQCEHCGNELSSQALFCGSCGTKVAAPESAEASPGTSGTGDQTELRAGLVELSEQLNALGAAGELTGALGALASSAGDVKHVTAIVGEKGRGKTTLVNRLLGADVLVPGANGHRKPISLAAADHWLRIDDRGNAEATAIPVATDLHVTSIHGPAEVLRQTTLLDTSALNTPEAELDIGLLPSLVEADAFLVCVAANQMLSQTERDVIRHQLLPLLAGDCALVVTHTDAIETEEDQQSLRKRAQRFAGDRMTSIFLPPPGLPPVEVLEFLRRSAAAHQQSRARSWPRKVAMLLSGIEQALADLDSPNDEAVPSPSRQERLEAFRRLVETEHSLALADAESALRLRLADLRLQLPDRLGRWTSDHMQHEGALEISSDVQMALSQAARTYATSLESSLSSGAPRSVELAVKGLSGEAVALGDVASMIDSPQVERIVRRLDLRIPLLALGGVGVATLVSVAVAPLVAIAALYASNDLRRRRDRALEVAIRTKSVESFSRWLADSESEFVGQLRLAIEPAKANLLNRVQAIVDAAPPIVAAPKAKGALELVRKCQALANRIAPQGNA